MFPNNFVGTLGATYASRGARESALAIATTMQYHVHRRVELPKFLGDREPAGRNERRVCHHPVFNPAADSVLCNTLPGRNAVLAEVPVR